MDVIIAGGDGFQVSMEVLERCNAELTTLGKRVREWMKDEEENRETHLYRDLENLLGFIGMALDEIDLLFLEEMMGVAEDDEINDLVIDVDWALNAYKQLL